MDEFFENQFIHGHIKKFELCVPKNKNTTL